MQYKYEVSVVIPTYNRSHCIEAAIDSVFKQTYTDYEVIIVDDGSTDNTDQVLNIYGDRIKYIYQPNNGVSAARNVGILNANGKWIAFLDSDDEWLPSKLEEQMAFIDKYPNVCAHVTDCLIIESDNEYSLFNIRKFPINKSAEVVIREPLVTILNLQPFTSSLIVKRNKIIEAGLFDEEMSLYEDFDCFCRIALLGQWGLTYKPLVRMYRKGRDEDALSHQHTENQVNSFLALIRIYNKLLNKNTLCARYTQLLKNKLSSIRFYLGLVYIRNYEKNRGNELVLRSAKDSFTLVSFFRTFIVLLFGLRGFDLVQRIKLRNKKEFRRSKGFIN